MEIDNKNNIGPLQGRNPPGNSNIQFARPIAFSRQDGEAFNLILGRKGVVWKVQGKLVSSGQLGCLQPY